MERDPRDSAGDGAAASAGGGAGGVNGDRITPVEVPRPNRSYPDIEPPPPEASAEERAQAYADAVLAASQRLGYLEQDGVRRDALATLQARQADDDRDRIVAVERTLDRITGRGRGRLLRISSARLRLANTTALFVTLAAILLFLAALAER